MVPDQGKRPDRASPGAARRHATGSRVRKTVERLRKAGVETYESCEGGAGHAYPEPTIAFRGGPEAGWRALSLCLAWRLPVESLRREWDVLDRNEPTGPYWKIVFRRRPG
jgi:hypothetical protein